MVLRQWKRPLTFFPRRLGDTFCKSEGLIQSGTHILSYCDDPLLWNYSRQFGRPGTGTYFTDFPRLPGTVFVRFSADVERDHDFDCYSCRSATIGSTRVARRAGMWHATRATTAKSSPTEVNVIASVSLTPKSCALSKRVNARASAVPTTRPASVSLNPWPRTRL